MLRRLLSIFAALWIAGPAFAGPSAPPTILKETLGAKLRRLAHDATISNPLINPFWALPPAWATSTAYKAEQVVSANGGWYVCMTAGTSSNSGSGPAATTGQITDGTAVWTWIGYPTISANDPNVPTFSATSSTPAGLTNFYAPLTYPGVFRIRGGYATTLASVYWQLQAFNEAASTPLQAGTSIDFRTDAHSFAIGITNNIPPVRVIIDGRYYSPDILLAASGNPNWLVFTLPTSNLGMHQVSVRIFRSGTSGFAGVRVSPNDQVLPPAQVDDVNAVFISDSIYQGFSFGPYSAGETLPQRISAFLGWSNPTNMSVGGTGYVNAGGGNYNFLQRVQDTFNQSVIASADIIVLMGSTNDFGLSGIATNVTSTIQTIRSVNQKAPIVVFGVWSINDSRVAATESAVQAGVTAANDANTTFIPLYGASPVPIITGSWNNSADTSSTNATQYINTSDNVHPIDIGTNYGAWWEAQAIKNSVLPNIN